MGKRWLGIKEEGVKEDSKLFHTISRVVDRNFVFGDEEREHFRMFMRMYENFSGCRVLSYCVMSNHFHLLLEVPPLPEGGILDAEMLKRLAFIYNEKKVAEVAGELAAAREEAAIEEAANRVIFESISKAEARGLGTEVGLEVMKLRATLKSVAAKRVEEIRRRFIRRMHNLSEFMKTLLHKFTCWFNRTHSRKGTLWEERFKSVIVEGGTAARMIAAYIDLNPVRAGMVSDPADYRWSSYGEAVNGGRKGNGRKARTGLLRMIRSESDSFPVEVEEVTTENWRVAVRRYRRLMGLALERKAGRAQKAVTEGREKRTQAEAAYYQAKADGKSAKVLQELRAEAVGTGVLEDRGVAEMLRGRVRYFSDGLVIGSKIFVNEAFAASRERFSEKRKDGARKMRGNGKAAAGMLWSVRDLRVDIDP